jgi:hypothetical protein
MQTENESIEKTVIDFVRTRFGNNESLSGYYTDWILNGPMFGRETSDHFVDLGRQQLGHKMESWAAMKDKAEERLEILQQAPLSNKNDYLEYQKGMEEFYISFFENQMLFQDAFQATRNMEFEKARQIIADADPDEAIQKYTDAIKIVGFSRGEKALVFSMNTRWKADFLDLKQQLGSEPVRFRFSPTKHDSLAQAPGHYSYYIDEENKWWRRMWKKELGKEESIAYSDSTLTITDSLRFDLRTIHGNYLSKGRYNLDVGIKNNSVIDIFVIDNDETTTHQQFTEDQKLKVMPFEVKGDNQILKIITSAPTQISGMVIKRIQ